jgi:lipopolysaccharide transport system ATP-binding protein
MIKCKFKDVSVEFPIHTVTSRSIKNTFVSKISNGRLTNNQKFPVIKGINNISFNLKPGDRLGVTGPNGSGKTTLLRTVAGIYSPASGTVNVKGRISSLLDVSFGLDPEATGLENIRMRGVLMGLSLKKIKSLEDEIADFTALGNFINLPVRSYSSGMNMRLGFAVSTAIPSDILLLDEWLSVGDADFSKKAEIRLNNMVKKSEIVIIASHDQKLIKKNCNQFLKLEY